MLASWAVRKVPKLISAGAWSLANSYKKDLTISRYHRGNVFYLNGSVKLTKEAAGKMFAVAAMRLFKVNVSVFLTKKRKTHVCHSFHTQV